MMYWHWAITVLLLIILGLVLLKIFVVVTTGKCKSQARLDGKTAIVTGANSGIGKETARDLARRGARVIMACRNLIAASDARDEIVKDTGNQNVLIKKLDLSDFDIVREFARDILNTESRLDILIHNAGLYLGSSGGAVNKNGIEMTFASNHLGSFLLTILLLNLLRKTAPSRIIIVSSSFAFLNWSNFATLDYDKLPQRGTAWLYCLTKHANALFMRELETLLKNTKVTVNAVHPGSVITNIVHTSNPIEYCAILTLIFFYKSAKDGAQPTIDLAVNPELENVSGQFWADCIGFNKVFRSEKELQNAKALWKKSEELVMLTDDERSAGLK